MEMSMEEIEKLWAQMQANNGSSSSVDDMLNSYSDPNFDALKTPGWRAVVITLYVLVITLGTLFNGIVLYLLVRNSSMWNVTNIFIGNLAVSDILLCMFNLPLQLYYQLEDNWVFGDFLCKGFNPLFGIPVYGSSLTMLLIAADRYWLIIFPLRNHMSPKMALSFIGLTVAFAFTTCIPTMVYSVVDEPGNYLNNTGVETNKKYCLEKWPSRPWRLTYSLGLFIQVFVLPFVITSVMYWRIYIRLKDRVSSRQTDNSRKHRTNKILMSIVGIFFCCWLPWNICMLLNEFSPTSMQSYYSKVIDTLLKIFAMSSAVINPFLYGWFNDNFRKELGYFVVKMQRKTSIQTTTKKPLKNGDADVENDNNAALIDHNNYTVVIDGLTEYES